MLIWLFGLIIGEKYIEYWLLLTFLFNVFSEHSSNAVDLVIKLFYLLFETLDVNLLVFFCNGDKHFPHLLKIFFDSCNLLWVEFAMLDHKNFAVSNPFLQLLLCPFRIVKLLDFLYLLEIISMVGKVQYLFLFTNFA